MKFSKTLLLAAALLAAPASATVTFDFETFPDTGYSVGAYTVLPYTVDGLTMTISRGGTAFDVNSFAGAPEFGDRSLSPFEFHDGSPFIADFSAGLTSISIDAGDYGADSETFYLSIYSGLGGTGTLLGSTSFAYGSSAFPTIASLGLSSGTPFLSAVFTSGDTGFPNSLYYDNIVVETAENGAVPEPGTWAMMLLGFGAMGWSLKRRRKLALA